MNILFVTPSYSPRIGGAESLMEDLSGKFISQGHKVTILTFKEKNKQLPKFDRKSDINIIRLNFLPNSIKNIGVQLVEIYKIIKKHKINTVCIGLFTSESLSLVLLRYIIKFKFIVYIHGGEIRKRIHDSNFLKMIFTLCLRNCDSVITVSNELKMEIVEFAPSAASKTFRIYNCIDTAKIKGAAQFTHKRDYILYAGRLHEEKGLNTLIKSFHAISQKVPNLDVLIAGAGPEEENLKKLVAKLDMQNRILFLGVQEREKVFSLLKGCIFLVLPSKSEGFPIIVLEALAAGKLTIGSNVRGISEIIKDKKNGILFAPDDIHQLSLLILEYYSSKQARLLIEDNIKKEDLSEYDVEKVYKKHFGLYVK